VNKHLSLCVHSAVLCKVNSLQKDRFPAASLASFSPCQKRSNHHDIP